MMTSRERVSRTLHFQQPDRAPRDPWALPGVHAHRSEELNALLQKYPSDFLGMGLAYGKSGRARPLEGETGSYVDEWGSCWEVYEPGIIGEVKHAPLEDWSALAGFQPPWELLNGASNAHINTACTETGLFVKAGSSIRPFERMQFLRGTENLFIDIAYGTRELYQLREMIHDFYLRELPLLTATDADAITFMDDWGTQLALLISPDAWLELFKPLYQDYCEQIHAAGKFVFFHSDGMIEAIYPHLIEVGVDAINSQLFCMDIESLADKYRGQVTFWGEICRQQILPFGTTQEVQAAVQRVRRALDDGSGGVIAQCEWGLKDPAENIEMVYESWLEASPFTLSEPLA